MNHYKLTFLGFGNVGQALAELLLRKQADLQAGWHAGNPTRRGCGSNPLPV